MYCTITQARQAGAVGNDDAVAEAIADARELIDRYTGDLFAPTRVSIAARVAPDGLAQLPLTVRTVESVRTVGAVDDLPATGYLVTSSMVRGQVDAIVLGGATRADVLVLGAEPWAGGYANLLGHSPSRIVVTGLFGRDAPPVTVRDCAAVLAAARTLGRLSVGGTPAAAGVPDTDDEGNAVSITVSADTPRASSTGMPEVDTALGPFVRQIVEVS